MHFAWLHWLRKSPDTKVKNDGFGLDITSVCTYLLGHAQTNSSLIVFTKYRL